MDYLFEKKKKQGHLTNYQFLMKRRQQKILGQTIVKTIAKPASAIKNQKQSIICNKALYVTK